jgi:hypothetical protein
MANAAVRSNLNVSARLKKSFQRSAPPKEMKELEMLDKIPAGMYKGWVLIGVIAQDSFTVRNDVKEGLYRICQRAENLVNLSLNKDKQGYIDFCDRMGIPEDRRSTDCVGWDTLDKTTHSTYHGE